VEEFVRRQNIKRRERQLCLQLIGKSSFSSLNLSSKS